MSRSGEVSLSVYRVDDGDMVFLVLARSFGLAIRAWRERRREIDGVDFDPLDQPKEVSVVQGDEILLPEAADPSYGATIVPPGVSNA